MELAACKQSLQSVLRQCTTLQVLTPAHVRIVLHNQEVSFPVLTIVPLCKNRAMLYLLHTGM